MGADLALIPVNLYSWYNRESVMGKLEIEQVIDKCERLSPPVQLNIQGDIEIIRSTTYVVSELVSNCIAQNARGITIVIENNRLTVSDDVCHPDVEQILANLNCRYPVTTKQPTYESEWGDSVGGIGIQESRNNLSKLGGSLTYHVSCGRIIADVAWK